MAASPRGGRARASDWQVRRRAHHRGLVLRGRARGGALSGLHRRRRRATGGGDGAPWRRTRGGERPGRGGTDLRPGRRSGFNRVERTAIRAAVLNGDALVPLIRSHSSYARALLVRAAVEPEVRARSNWFGGPGLEITDAPR